MKWIKNEGRESWPDPGGSILAWVEEPWIPDGKNSVFTTSYFAFGRHLENGSFILYRSTGRREIFEKEVKYFLTPEPPEGEEE